MTPEDVAWISRNYQTVARMLREAGPRVCTCTDPECGEYHDAGMGAFKISPRSASPAAVGASQGRVSALQTEPGPGNPERNPT